MGVTMKPIVLATHNKAKLRDLMQGFEPLTKHGYTIHTLSEFNIADEPDETGKTFQENALLKARYYAAKCGMAAIADDGGLTIDALNGEPGVYSRRWTGHTASDEELIAYTLERMKDIPEEKRSAHMGTCLCFYDPSTQKHMTVTESIKGTISRVANPSWTKGYPYRAVFMVDEYKTYYDNLTADQHARINHRLKAIAKLIEMLDHSQHA